MRRGGGQWRPVRVRIGGGIPVRAGSANGGDWPPEVIGELGVPNRNERVRHRHVQQRKKPGAIHQTQWVAATAKRAALPSVNPGASELWNRAMSVCSGVRVELLRAPRALISLKSAV